MVFWPCKISCCQPQDLTSIWRWHCTGGGVITFGAPLVAADDPDAAPHAFINRLCQSSPATFHLYIHNADIVPRLLDLGFLRNDNLGKVVTLAAQVRSAQCLCQNRGLETGYIAAMCAGYLADQDFRAAQVLP